MIKDSYIYQRQAIGFMGMLLPVVVLLVGFIFGYANLPHWWLSISATFYTNAGPIFTGLMFCAGVFLITYTGYKKIDFWLTAVTGVAGIGLAWCSCFTEGFEAAEKVGVFGIPIHISGVIHIVCAGIFFVLLAVNSIFLFTRSSGNPTPEKIRRNKIYKVCGYGMLIALFIEVMFSIFYKGNFPHTIILEAIMLWFFGISWLVKGEAIKGLNDKKKLSPEN